MVFCAFCRFCVLVLLIKDCHIAAKMFICTCMHIPGDRMFAPTSNPFLQNSHSGLFRIIMFASYSLDPFSSSLFQEEGTKCYVIRTNLLANVDSSLSPSKPDTFNQGWSVNLDFTCGETSLTMYSRTDQKSFEDLLEYMHLITSATAFTFLEMNNGV